MLAHSDPLLVQTKGLPQLRRPLGEDADHGVCIALRQALQPLQGCLEPAGSFFSQSSPTHPLFPHLIASLTIVEQLIGISCKL